MTIDTFYSEEKVPRKSSEEPRVTPVHAIDREYRHYIKDKGKSHVISMTFDNFYNKEENL
jgi:hypothetical protein